MSELEKRKGGGKLARSETVTVRLDPKLRYLADLAARKQRRTLSSYIEWVIEDSLDRTYLNSSHNNSLAAETGALWDVDEADRFVKLALHHPDLLTHEEQVRWKLIRENGFLWRGRYVGSASEWTWTVKEESLIFDRLREHWADFCKAAETGEKIGLPTWVVKSPPANASPSVFDVDDDIPF